MKRAALLLAVVSGCATGGASSSAERTDWPDLGSLSATSGTVVDLPLADARVTSARVVKSSGDSVVVDFSPDATYPGLRIGPAFPWNWQADGGMTLVLDVTNPSRDEVAVGLRVDDGEIPDGNFVAVSAKVAPGEHRLVLPLGGLSPAAPYTLPGRSHKLATRPGSIVLHPRPGSVFDLSHVTAVTVYLSHPVSPATLTINRLTRVADHALLGLVVAW
jgi:hypothetical protein